MVPRCGLAPPLERRLQARRAVRDMDDTVIQRCLRGCRRKPLAGEHDAGSALLHVRQISHGPTRPADGGRLVFARLLPKISQLSCIPLQLRTLDVYKLDATCDTQQLPQVHISVWGSLPTKQRSIASSLGPNRLGAGPAGSAGWSLFAHLSNVSYTTMTI